MKFILNGRTFDTANSTPVAVTRGAGNYATDDSGESFEQVRYERMVYRTTKGAFFLHEHRTVKLGKGKPVVIDNAEELMPDEVVGLIRREGAAILDGTGLDLPEEA